MLPLNIRKEQSVCWCVCVCVCVGGYKGVLVCVCVRVRVPTKAINIIIHPSLAT